MHHPPTHRAGRVLVHALVLIVIGGVIGTADAFIRADRLAKRRAAPPPLTIPDAPAANRAQQAPAQPATPTGGEPAPTPPITPAPAASPQAAPAQPAAFVFTPADKLPAGHITVQQALHLYNEGATFIDARRKDLYVEGHVPQAFRADMASFRGREPGFVSMLPKDMVLVVYCGGGNCDESEHVAQLLDASGFKTIYIMHDGFPGWKAAGYDVETGEGME